MKTGIKVGDIMTKNLVAVSPEISVKACVKKMFKEKTGSLIVMSNSSLAGLITKKDVLRTLLRNKNLSEIKASEAMTKRVRTISPEKDLYEALILMKKTKIKKLPVTSSKEVIGLLTMNDILKVEPQLFDYIAEAVHIREERAKLRRREEAKMAALEGLEPESAIEGPCEECGNYDLLAESDGRLICSECVDSAR